MALSGVEERTWADSSAAHSEVITWIPRDPEKCFDYVADVLRHSEWATNRIEITSVDSGHSGVGSPFRAIGHQGGKDWPADPEITVFDRPSTFEFTATGGPIGTPDDDPHRHTFTFAPEGEGTRITLVRRDPLPPSWSGLKRSLTPIVVRLTLGIRKRTVANLRARLTA